MFVRVRFMSLQTESLLENCPYLEFFWSVFFRIWTEYGDLLCKYLYPVQLRKNADQKNSEYGHFLRRLYFEF